MVNCAEQNKKARWQAVQSLLTDCRKGFPLHSISRSEILLLSFGQERLWLLSQMGADDTVYHLPFAFWMNGSLNVTVLASSLQEIIRRHEILRTRFPAIGTQCIPVIAPNWELKLPTIDLQSFTPAEQEAQYERIHQDEVSRPFDLAQEPLWRFQLIRFAEQKYVLLMTIHHLIYDGWSQTVFTKELSTLYQDFSSGQSSSLPDLPIQYADFAYWQRQWLTGEVLQARQVYWQRQLAGDPPGLRLPFDRSTGQLEVTMTYRGARQPVAFSPQLTSALKDLSDRQGVTLFVVLIAAFNLLLYQYTQQKDIIVCSTQAGRNLSPVQGLIGLCNTIVPIRTNLSGNPSFLDLIDRIHQVVLEAYHYQDIPFHLLAEICNLTNRRLSQVMFVLQNTPSELLKLPGVEVQSDYLANGTANFDLFLSLLSPDQSVNQIRGYLEYKTDLFTASAITRLLEDFQALLTRLVEQPQQYLSELPLLEMNDSTVHEGQTVEMVDGVASATALFVAPRTAIEQQLAQIWSALLGQERISIHDNFFALGGHSLLATQVISRINTMFAAELPILPIFQYPTIAALAEVIQTYLQQGHSLPTCPIQPAPRDHPLPLSFAQQRLWFLDRFGNSVAYNLPIAISFQGALNIPSLHRALQTIVQRHESLRTTFISKDGMPYQVIHPNLTINLPVIDLSDAQPDEQRLAVQQLAATEATTSFDLSRDPMLRATLLHLGHTSSPVPSLPPSASTPHHILLLTLHHIAADGWSIEVLLQELTVLYTALSQNQPSPLGDLSIQYADFAIWQRHHLQGEVLAQQLNYWKAQLTDAPSLLQLPTDFPRSVQERFQGDAVAIAIDPLLTQQLRQLSQQQGTTLYMTLLSAFQILMARYSGQSDVVVGSPIANRNRQELESLIGFFVNTLAMRVDLSEVNGQPPSFIEILAQVKTTAQAAYDHQDLPFEQLVGELQLERNLNYHPLVQVFFVWHGAALDAVEMPGITMVPLELETHTSRVDLELHLWEREGGLSGQCIYKTDLFQTATIQRMMGHFQSLLAGIVAEPERSPFNLPLLTAAECHQLLVEWNCTQVEYAQDTVLHQLFEQQAEQTPDAIALVFETERLTYRELNQRANQLAHYLQTVGVGSEVLVGICMARSLDMVIAMLAVLKAGGAYVPLDPTYPAERLTYMLSATHVPVLLTQQQWVGMLTVSNTHVICLDRDQSAIVQCPTGNPVPLATPNSLAYVLYTSGSTGLPKGVAIEHHSPVALVHWARSVFSPEELQGVLASTSICFDLSVFELFVPLSLGGTVILAENALQIPTLPAAQEITLINTVPSAIAELLRINAIPPGVRTINLAGEALSNMLVQQLYQQTTTQRVFNLYGPSEDTTYSTVALIERGASSVTIGRPIDNTVVYILDRYQQPVPIGVSGELYIGGSGLARGYLNQPELTQAKFIPNPFNPDSKSRLYRTGDLVRYLPDGTMEFLGRIDHQVKIRGFRIELGEIEAMLQQYSNQHSDPDESAIENVLVMARTDETGNTSLVAYLTPDLSDRQLTEIRHYLKAKLPGYMVPSAIVSLNHFPQTPNGKVDRKALPAPNFFFSALSAAAPGNAIEETIAAVWRQVLRCSEVSIHDNFFDVGGHSLLVVQIHHQLSSAYPFLTIVDLFTYPTIHSLANYVLHQTGSSQIESEIQEAATFTRSPEPTSQARGARRRTAQAMRQRRGQSL